VWEDENFDHAQWCLDNFEKYKGDFSDKELVIVRRSLEELAALPQSAWDVEPADYDGRNPDDYPPPEGVEMVKINEVLQKRRWPAGLRI
jgi:hypothetical protein